MTYAAIAIESIPHPGTYRAALVPLSESSDVLGAVAQVYTPRTEELLHINVFTTRRRAAEVVAAWNESYRLNGTSSINYIPRF